MVKRNDIPAFGPLQGVRVLHSSLSVAGPFAVELMAEWGADVVWIENPMGPDITRLDTGAGIDFDRRNQREISLNIASPEGKEVFLRQLAETDIFLECSKPGQYAKWGLTDEVMWEANPKLIIVHISGFGQECAEEYYGRASYDPIAQAVGGMMYINSIPGTPASPILPVIADYYTALFACSSALASYTRVLKGGMGESIDVAQFEAILRLSSVWAVDTWNNGRTFDRVNNHNGNSGTAGYRSFMCKDGYEVYVLILGPGVMKAACDFFELPYGSDMIPVGSARLMEGTPGGDLLTQTLTDYFLSKDALEAENELAALGIPCASILTYEQMLDHPLFKSRNSIIEYPGLTHDSFTACTVVPRFKNAPGQVWRGGPSVGCDNDDVLEELGYSASEIDALYEKGIISKASEN